MNNTFTSKPTKTHADTDADGAGHDCQLALLICGAAVWMQRDLMHIIDLLDAQCRIMRDMIQRLPRLARRDRELLATLAQRIERQRLETLALIVTPDTLRRWYRQLVIAKWTHPPTGKPGRPSVDPTVAALAVRIARENPGMGSPGIALRLRHLGHAISATPSQPARCAVFCARMASIHNRCAITTSIGRPFSRPMPIKLPPLISPPWKLWSATAR